MAKDKVLVVGAGLAGLSCALELQNRGIPFLLIEASDGVGGRVRTDEHEGFLLDRGFQVYLTAYEEGLRTLDYAALNFKSFKPGAIVRVSGDFVKVADPWRNKASFLSALFTGLGTFKDKVRMRAFRNEVLGLSDEEILQRDNHSILGILRRHEFSQQMIDRFFRPLAGGIVLETSMLQSSRIFEFVFKMMALSDTVVPAKGMGEITKQLAGKLPTGSIRLNSKVTNVNEDGVILESGERITGAGTVVACEGPEASRLIPSLPCGRWRGVANIYFEAPEPPVQGPWMVLNGNGQWPINNMAVMSEVSSAYAPDGKALISAAILGRPSATDKEIRGAVGMQLNRWYGAQTKNWRHLRTYRITRAQPDITPVSLSERPPRIGPGVYVAGDYYSMPTIHFAMLSGRRAAEAVVEDLAGERVAAHTTSGSA